MFTSLATGATGVLTAIAAAGKAVQVLAVVVFARFQFVLADASAQWNVVLNVFTIAVAIGLAIPVVRSRRKDQTIKDLQESFNAKDRRVKELRDEAAEREQKIRQIEQAAIHCQTEAAEWRGKYEEAKQYTAREAVEHFEQVQERHSSLVAERHAVLIDQGRANAEALAQVVATLGQIQAKLDR